MKDTTTHTNQTNKVPDKRQIVADNYTTAIYDELFLVQLELLLYKMYKPRMAAQIFRVFRGLNGDLLPVYMAKLLGEVNKRLEGER